MDRFAKPPTIKEHQIKFAGSSNVRIYVIQYRIFFVRICEMTLKRRIMCVFARNVKKEVLLKNTYEKNCSYNVAIDPVQVTSSSDHDFYLTKYCQYLYRRIQYYR